MRAKIVTISSIYCYNITNKSIIKIKKRLPILAVLKKASLLCIGYFENTKQIKKAS